MRIVVGALMVALVCGGMSRASAGNHDALVLRKLSPDLRRLADEATRANVAAPRYVTALMEAGTPVPAAMSEALLSREVAGFQWVTGSVDPSALVKLATAPGVISVLSSETYQTAEVRPEIERGLERAPLTAREIRALVAEGGMARVEERLAEVYAAREPIPMVVVPPNEAAAAPRTTHVVDIHGARAAWAKGFTGDGVVAAVIDTGVDFAHPDLAGTQARVPFGDYAGWPYAYDTFSGAAYAADASSPITPATYWDKIFDTHYVTTAEVTGATCNGTTCSATFDWEGRPGGTPTPISLMLTWPDTSQSGTYRWSVHPDWFLLNAGMALDLGYAETAAAPPILILSDETTAGVYDTVYVDADFDQDLTDEKPMRMGDELAGSDFRAASGGVGTDGVWDVSAGMLGWISDGAHPPPGVAVVYPSAATAIPPAGHLIVFICDSDSHGTNCAGDIVAQGVITDPSGLGTSNPRVAGGANVGGVGGPVLSGTAPGARVAAMPNGFNLPLDAWTIAVLGFDGMAGTGDEANIVSNSWGSSETVHDGWDATSRFVHELNRTIAPTTAFLVSTGNGGHGYGTVTSPGGATIIDVGASTQYGSTKGHELVGADQLLWGDVQPWSNRGPGLLGDLAPDIVTVGAWGTGVNPLNVNTGNGEKAYGQFGGTSMSCPVAAGCLALVYQAFHDTNGRWPTWAESHALLKNGARDLGYDVLVQGAGNLDADASTDLATGATWSVAPDTWQAGDFRGAERPAFPNVLAAGETDVETLEFANPTGAAVTIDLAAEELVAVHEEIIELPFGNFSAPPFTQPTWVQEITDRLATHDPDLVRAQLVFPFSTFDSNADYLFEARWRVLFYDWTDLNGDSNLWTDTNANGRVDSSEIDIEAGTLLSEYHRFSFGYPSGTMLEARVGRDSLARMHDGLFVGVQRRTGSQVTTLQLRLTYYKHAPWSWVALEESSVVVPAGGGASVQASLTVPAGTRPGTWQGRVRATAQGGRTTIVPVVAHVAADSLNFEFGAETLKSAGGTRPFDNGRLFGGFDWSWRYESGDWRAVMLDLDAATAAPGNLLLVDTSWLGAQTDVDTFVLTPVADSFSASDPGFYGPHGAARTAGSRELYRGSGRFTFDTATGGPRELVGAAVADGLNVLVFHHVLGAGAQHGEPFVGRASRLGVVPYPADGFGASGSMTVTVTADAGLDDGIAVAAFGLRAEDVRTGETAMQDTPGSVCTASWVESVDVVHGGLLAVTTTSAVPGLDIDLFLYRDDGDDVFICENEELVTSSTSATAEESVELAFPDDGRYWITVHGFGVPGGVAPFDVTIENLSGDDLTVTGVPDGPIAPGEPVPLQLDWATAESGEVRGALFLGPTSAPTALRVPVRINTVVAPAESSGLTLR